MNRYAFTTPKVIPKCQGCTKPIGRHERAYRGTNNAWFCDKCYKLALTSRRSKGIIKASVSEIWERKKGASLIYPERIYMDGQNVLDMISQQYIHMKAWDILKYYSRVEDAEKEESAQ